MYVGGCVGGFAGFSGVFKRGGSEDKKVYPCFQISLTDSVRLNFVFCFIWLQRSKPSKKSSAANRGGDVLWEGVFFLKPNESRDEVVGGCSLPPSFCGWGLCWRSGEHDGRGGWGRRR